MKLSLGKNAFLRGGAILFAGNTIGNVCNYLFQFYMKRHMTDADYGGMVSLLSLLTISGVPALSITLVAAKFVSTFKAKEELYKIKPLFRRLAYPIGFFGAILTGILLLGSGYIASFLKIPSILPVFFTILTLYISFLLPVIMGLLQGMQWFIPLGLMGALGGIGKLLFCAILVQLGFALNGAMGGLFASSLAVLCFCAWFLRDLPPSDQSVTDLGIGVRKVVGFTVPVVFSTLGLMALTNIDMVLVKHYFDPDRAGQYAQIAVLGRTIFYLPGIIVMVFFPMVAESHARNQSTIRLLFQALLATAFLSGTGAVIFWCVPDLMLTILFGATFEEADTFLRLFSFPMFLIALINILINFLLAKDSHRFIYYMLAFCGLEILAISFFHETIQSVILIVFGASLALLLFLLVDIVFLFRKK